MNKISMIIALSIGVFITNSIVAQNFSGGNGTTASPYLITTAAQLDDVRNFLDKSFILGNDIDLAAYINEEYGSEGWNPIGEYRSYDSEEVAFTGTFNGNNHAIINLRINRPAKDSVGLFGVALGAEFTNVSIYLDKAGVVGRDYVGGFVGYAGLNGTVGMFGKANKFLRCRVVGEVEGRNYVGGLVAYLIGRESELRESRFVGKVRATGNYVGGLAGSVNEGSYPVVNEMNMYNCYVWADVVGQDNVGGLIGFLGQRAWMHNSYAQGNLIKGRHRVGGVIGGTDTLGNSEVEKCVAITTNLQGNDSTGYIAGYYPTSNPGNGPADTTYRWNLTPGPVSGIDRLDGMPAIEDSLKSASFYRDAVGWDFTTVWTINPTLSPYPILRTFDENEQTFTGLIGLGTDASPYRIYSAAQLDSMRTRLSSSFILVNNINLYPYIDVNYGLEGWLPVGTSGAPFTGKLFGDKFVIENLRINRPGTSNVGLFGYMNGAYVDSLGVHINATDSVKGADNVGGIAGTMKNSIIRDSYLKGSVMGEARVGGIAGSMEGSTILQSYAVGGVKGDSRLGGLAGEVYNDSRISKSYALNNVWGSSSTSIGGLAGHVYGTAPAVSAVDSSVAINPSVKGLALPLASVGRLIGSLDVNNLSVDNYSFDGMNGQFTSTDSTLNGTLTSLSNLQSQAFYETNLDWYFAADSGWAIQGGKSFPHLAWELLPDLTATPVSGVCQGTAGVVSINGANKNNIEWVNYLNGNANAIYIGNTASINPDWNGSGNILVSLEYYDNLEKRPAHAETMLFVNAAYYVEKTGDSFCPGDYYISDWNGVHLIPANWTAPTITFYDSLQTVSGCDSILKSVVNVGETYAIVLNETVGRGTTGSPWGTAMPFDSYFNANTLGVKDTTVRYPSMYLCDSTVTYRLIVIEGVVTNLYDTVVVGTATSPWSEAPFGNSFNAKTVGNKDTLRTLATSSGSDSTVVFHLTVTKGTATITINPTQVTKVYGDPLLVLELGVHYDITYDNYLGGGTAPIDTSWISANWAGASATSPVGNYTYTLRCDDPNYTVPEVSGSFVIVSRPAVVKADDVTKQYGDPNPPFTATFTNVLSEDLASLQAAVQYSCAATTTSPVGSTIDIIPTVSIANYTVTPENGILTIGKRAVTVQIRDTSKQEFEDDPPFLYDIVSGSLVDGDNFTGQLGRTPGERADTYVINGGTLSLGSNYDLTILEGVFIILDAIQIITWDQDLSNIGCGGATVIGLTATSNSHSRTPMGPPIEYRSSDLSVATINGNVLTIVGAGVVTITASQSGNVHYRAADIVTKTVSVGLPYDQYLRQKWDDVLVFDNTGNQYRAYQWYKNGDAIAGATYQTYTEKTVLNGTYLVEAERLDGSKVRTCPWAISPTPSPVAAEMLKVYPNPVGAGQPVTVEINLSREALQGAYINIIDVSGNIVRTLRSVEPVMHVNMPEKSGYYILMIYRNGQESLISKILVQ